MWDIEQLKIQKKKKKNPGKNKNSKFLSLKPHTYKFSIITGIFRLKHISAPHYKYFTIKGMLSNDLSAEF